MMNKKIFVGAVLGVAMVFTIIFGILIIPPFLENPDIVAAFGAGFVNPYASGYSTDVLCCWAILCLWVLYESPKVKHGWICLLLGIIPGVAVGFGLYLWLRMKQMEEVV